MNHATVPPKILMPRKQREFTKQIGKRPLFSYLISPLARFPLRLFSTNAKKEDLRAQILSLINFYSLLPFVRETKLFVHAGMAGASLVPSSSCHALSVRRSLAGWVNS